MNVVKWYDVQCEICGRWLSSDFKCGMWLNSDFAKREARKVGFKTKTIKDLSEAPFLRRTIEENLSFAKITICPICQKNAKI